MHFLSHGENEKWIEDHVDREIAVERQRETMHREQSNRNRKIAEMMKRQD